MGGVDVNGIGGLKFVLDTPGGRRWFTNSNRGNI